MASTGPMVLAAVVNSLRARGYSVALEYPGYVCINTETGVWSIGTANKWWAGECYTLDDPSAPVAGFISTLPADCTDINAIVTLIEKEVPRVGA